MASTPDQPNCFTPGQLNLIGAQNAALLLDRVGWISRRREAVEILDETALRRQITVDFTLPSVLPDGTRSTPLSDRGHCAPILVLPKRPANLMEFDFLDANGASLPLATLHENGEISAATLIAMAEDVLGRVPSPGTADSLWSIAIADAGAGELKAEQLLASAEARFGGGDLERLAQHDRFRWWLFTLSHSSLIMAPVEQLDQRAIVKLSYREPILSEVRSMTSLGWKPYSVHVDSSFIAAGGFHFEAHSPTGLRIDDADLASDTGASVPHEDSTQRRTHLYLESAEKGRATTAVLALRVAATGFLRDAWLASALVAAAIASCLNWAKNIVENGSSAPALLLVLPGLIATYLGRPDRHGLTQRLLVWSRRTLMVSAFLAYATAARVALSGSPPQGAHVAHQAEALRWFLRPTLAIAVICVGILLIARLRSDHMLGVSWEEFSAWIGRRRASIAEAFSGTFTLDQQLKHEPQANSADVQKLGRRLCRNGTGPQFAHLSGHQKKDDWHFLYARTLRYSYYEIDFLLTPAREGTRVSCRGYWRARRAARLLTPMRTVCSRRRARRGLRTLVSP